MATITIRNLDDETKQKLRELAARNGRSMEEEVRQILNEAVARKSRKGLGTWIHQQFAEHQPIDLELPARSTPRPAPFLGDSS